MLVFSNKLHLFSLDKTTKPKGATKSVEKFARKNCKYVQKMTKQILKVALAINATVGIIQVIVIFIQIDRWNELIGAIFSLAISLLPLYPKLVNDLSSQVWFIYLHVSVVLIDSVFICINLVLAICLIWSMDASCLENNRTVYLPFGVSCAEWRKFGKFDVKSLFTYLIQFKLLFV